MYVPDHFREDRPEVLHDAVRRIGFATLVTQGLEANHLPMLLEGDVLRGHVARANPQWRMLGDNGNSLAQLKAFVEKVSDPRDREELLRAIRQLELVMPSYRPAEIPGAPRQVADRPPAPPPALPADALLVTDPAAAYTREVKAALIEAMLENSGPLAVANDEWLVVAARDSEPGNRPLGSLQGSCCDLPNHEGVNSFV